MAVVHCKVEPSLFPLVLLIMLVLSAYSANSGSEAGTGQYGRASPVEKNGDDQSDVTTAYSSKATKGNDIY